MADTKELKGQREKALAGVREKRAALEGQLPELERGVLEAKAKLDAAQLAVHVAAGTPGFEDDRAAAQSVAAAQSALERAVAARDAAVDQLGVLERAEQQLVGEIGALEGQLTTARITAARAALAASVLEQADVFAKFVRDGVALEAIGGNSAVYADNLLNVLAADAGVDVQKLIEQGKQRAQAIRSGREEA